MFSLLNFSSIFLGGHLTQFAPMCGRPCSLSTSRTIYRPTSCLRVFLCIFVFCYFAVPFIDWLYCTDLFRRIAASLFNKLTYFTDLSSTFSLLVHDAGQHQQTEYQA